MSKILDIKPLHNIVLEIKRDIDIDSNYWTNNN